MRCTPVLAAIAVCVTLIVAGSASADTIKTGGNVINETWTPAGNPYVVQGDLTVPSGSFLTIQAGTIVQFASSDSQGSGLDSGRVELIVRGTLDVQGTAMAPVTMSGAASGAWYGLELDTTAASVSLANLTITNPARGVSYGATGATFSSANLIVQSASQYGLYASAGSPTIDGFTAIAAGSAGVYVDLAGALTLTNCVLRNNGGYGIEFAPTSGARALTVTNCSINANGSYGIRTLASTAGTVTITGSIITNHTAYGVARSDSSTVTTTYSDVWNNSSANFLGGTQSNNLASNPLFVSSTNLRLTSNSPARFGTSAMTDQGALPYVADATPGLYGTLWVPTTLSLAQSPYTVPGDLTVAPGVSLTIPAGVTLSFASSDLMFAGIDPGRPELQVSGALVADGTPASPITLTGTASGAWYGVELLSAAAGSLLDNVVITNPARGLSLYATGANTLSAITVQSASQYGLYAAAGSPTADAFTAITAGSAGVYVDLAGALTLTNCVLRNNGGYGIEFAPTSGARALTVTNCSINANGSYGIRTLASTAGTVTVANSIITNHTAYGVARSDSSTVTTTYSDVWNNSSANFLGGTQSNNLTPQNPQYVSSTNLALVGSSVCIDAGTATGAPDHDALGVSRPLDGDGINGTGYDLGAYEFALIVVCGNGAVEPGEVCDSGAQNGQYGFCNGTCTGLGPRCGDGMPNGPEQCDDGNTSNTDACLNTCVTATCGDGVVRQGMEQCDDGNASNTDACLTTCVAATCGDGFVRATVEQCDDGNASNTDACLTTCVAASCGDGFVHAGSEQCDDKNTSNTDACLNSCMTASCGDGFVEASVEQCDDGNASDTDACVGACVPASCGDGFVRAGVEQCDDANAINTDACLSCQNARCGDGVTEAGVEDCDDANAVDTDACRNTCKAATCGDGVIRTGVEQCDDGNTIGTDACTASCQNAVCGDGITHVGVEDCDDANAVDTDACITCAAARCGDGHVHAGVEGCDDGNTDNTDACTNACVSSSCGDGTVQAGEECDDANQIDTDTCRNSCLAARCGDGVIELGVETCDDGNADPGDGCGATCLIETPDAGLPDAGVAGVDSAGASDAGVNPAPDTGCCSTSGGRDTGLCGALAVLLARRRRRRAAG